MTNKLAAANKAWLKLRREVKGDNRDWAVDAAIAERDAILASMSPTEYLDHLDFIRLVINNGKAT